jgi:hypothetical protein
MVFIKVLYMLSIEISWSHSDVSFSKYGTKDEVCAVFQPSTWLFKFISPINSFQFHKLREKIL